MATKVRRTRQTILLVVDLQTAAFDGVTVPPIHRAERLVQNVRALLDTARAEHVPIVHIQHCGLPGEPFGEEAPGFPIFKSVGPNPGELVVQKRSANAFEGTDLHQQLQKIGVQTLVVAGLQSEQCVAATCRGALQLGYAVQLAADAHSTWSDDERTADQIIEAENAALESEGVCVRATAALLGILGSRGPAHSI